MSVYASPVLSHSPHTYDTDHTQKKNGKKKESDPSGRGVVGCMMSESPPTLDWSSVTPGSIEYLDNPGDTTCASCMYLHAVVGFFQNARCMMVDRSSPANARETAPPDLNECIEKSPCTPAAAALCFRSSVIRLAEKSGSEPSIGVQASPIVEMVGNRQHFAY